MLAQNLTFGVLVTAASAAWVPRRPRELGLVFAAFLSHLVGDYFGSGPGWGLWPFLPFSDRFFLFEHAWSIVGWQNVLVTLAGIGVALAVAVRFGRTPLEFVHTGADRAVVETLRRRFSALTAPFREAP